MLKAFADEHIVFPIVQALRARGMDVVTVQDRSLQGTDDSVLLDATLQDERVMLTNDRDFLVLAADRAARQEVFAPVFYWPQQRRTIGEVVRSVIREASQGDYSMACSRVYFL
ncbi:MAG: DUF5615 family PIN-like protein [Candidatus Nealsonbacteria bacterium]|nr:DUF5615 family PIN-like protein [Candidatus Nealsonbacteria bacterium]